MKNISDSLKKQALKLLQDKEVDLVIGYEPGFDLLHTSPLFASTPEEAQGLLFNPFSITNLTKLLLNYDDLGDKVAIVVKGCDSRGINRLLYDKQLNRDRIVVLGVNCPGQLDPEKVFAKVDARATLQDVTDKGESFVLKTSSGEVVLAKKDFLRDKCLVCENPNPVVSDHTFGETQKPGAANDYADVKELEAKSAAEKSAYWDKQFSRCIRCNACRNICTACSCRSCVFDSMEPYWVGKRTTLSDNSMFHLTRAMHVAGRCVDCGECDRVCPMDIPLRRLNQKILRDLKELFGTPTPGSSLETEAALGVFKPEDPEEFM